MVMLINSKNNHKLKFIHDSFRFKDKLKEGITLVDKNGFIKDIQGVDSFFGVKKEKLIGKRYYDLFPRSNDSIFEEYLKESLDERKIFGFELYFENDGKENWFLITINPNDEGFSIYFKSINEIKRLEQQLKKTKENYKRILENSGEIIIECDENFKIKYINVPCFAGYSSDEVLGFSIKKFIAPDDLSDFENILMQRKNMISTKIRYEQKILSKSKDFLWYNVSTTTLTDKNGEFNGLISILSDITYLKETEICLSDINVEKVLKESFGAGIFLIDKTGKIKYSNNKMNEILGHINPEGKYMDDFMNCSWSAQFKDILKKWENGYEEIEELRFNRLDGKIIWAAITSKVIYNKNKKFLGVLGISTDVTTQKIVEGSLSQREENLKSTITEMSVVLNSFIKNHYNQDNEKNLMDN